MSKKILDRICELDTIDYDILTRKQAFETIVLSFQNEFEDFMSEEDAEELVSEILASFPYQVALLED